MSCNTYIHNDTYGGSKNISGTTCDGTVGYYTLTYGQSICMDDSKPLLNLNGLELSGSCLAITPTPSPTNPTYCILNKSIYLCFIKTKQYENKNYHPLCYKHNLVLGMGLHRCKS